MSIWAASPVLLYISPSLFDLIEPATDLPGYFDHVGMGWLFIGIGGLLFRTFHLFYLHNIQTGLVWMTKIITDPFHDILLYWKSPGYLLQGERMDPMLHVREHSPPSRS